MTDTRNRARSIMGPECSFCDHRAGWHGVHGCSRTADCRCAGFDNGTWPGMLNQIWHKVLGHNVVNATTLMCDDAALLRKRYEFHCSCGKTWN